MIGHTPFGERLQAGIRDRGRLCVGIDPTPQDLHAWGLEDTAQDAVRFAAAIIEASAGLVPIVKPQSAYFERWGPHGIVALAHVCALAREARSMVLLDAKRGDIGSTNRAYAEAYLRRGQALSVDAMTVSPFAGLDTLSPFVDVAKAEGAGLFVLARTSNPGSRSLQTARTDDGRSVADEVLAWLGAQNGDEQIGSFGCVVGATVDDPPAALASFNGFVLAPGIGAQGASPADLSRRFPTGWNVLPTVSRAIAAAGPRVASIAAVVKEERDACTEALGFASATEGAR
ncbi:orotidine-5'-phosphate decarboxylase [Microbacterium allomyrinae]|uniref:Orotidine-5'-phosphate decarboxylase n=1 Tax=Microbacterium allomyrinae TaxID=2830666 RepID=A0A9X1LXL1_9MICO|nr:orotidine-5'-phosphate decarboxylase [Microbacterium allomyrinae]MCC2033215.1 orotidine-5'-phosphate decarboxylase [Microbacterium allomyrinae]